MLVILGGICLFFLSGLMYRCMLLYGECACFLKLIVVSLHKSSAAPWFYLL